MRSLCVLLLVILCDAAFIERCLVSDKRGGCIIPRPPWAGQLLYMYHRTRNIQRASGVIIPLEGVSKHRKNAPNPANNAPVGDVTGYERGHIIGVSNGGTDNPENIVGQPAAWQKNGVWGQLETDLHDDTFTLYQEVAGLGWENKPTYSTIGDIGLFPAPSKLVWIRYTIQEWAGVPEQKYPSSYYVEFRIINVHDATKPNPKAIPLGAQLEYQSTFYVHQPLAPRQQLIHRRTDELDFGQLIVAMIKQHSLENQRKGHLSNDNIARAMALGLRKQPEIWNQIQNKLNGLGGHERERRYAELLNQIEKQRQNQGEHRTEDPMDVEQEALNSNSQNLHVIDYNGDGNVNYMFVEEMMEYVAMFMIWIIALCVLCLFGCVGIYYFCNNKNQMAMMMSPN